MKRPTDQRRTAASSSKLTATGPGPRRIDPLHPTGCEWKANGVGLIEPFILQIAREVTLRPLSANIERLCSWHKMASANDTPAVHCSAVCSGFVAGNCAKLGERGIIGIQRRPTKRTVHPPAPRRH